MENLVEQIDPSFWHGKKVFVTGHTGFKGGWIVLWLHRLGANIYGYSLNPPTRPNLFEIARVGNKLESDSRADLADFDKLCATVEAVKPDIIFHLAAQPLVRDSYRDPLGTLMSNVNGTAHVLEAVRQSQAPVRAVVIITTDKVYDNQEWDYPYREIDALGGHDPYSASKAAAELVTASYRASFFSVSNDNQACIATVRSGNVVGGGDWGRDRLVPDCLAAFQNNEPVRLRFPKSIRPWQHVLEPLAGYLQLAQRLCGEHGWRYGRSWNLGPNDSGDATVARIAETVARNWGSNASVELASSDDNPHESGLLRLDSTMAHTSLGWHTKWSLDEALSRTVAWHKAWQQGEDMSAFSLREIGDYESTRRA